MTDKMKVAVLWVTKEIDYESEKFLKDHVTDWLEVTREEYFEIAAWAANLNPKWGEGRFSFVVADVNDFVKMSMPEIKKAARERAEKAAKDKAAREAKAAARRAAKAKATVEEKKALLKKLKAELGDTE